VDIGEAWLRGDIRISTEHFASTYLRGRLLALLQSYPARRAAPPIIVGCAAGERHDIGGLMLALLLRREGYRVEFLGADVPTEDLLDYVRDVRPALVCLSAGSEEPARELARVHRGLAKMRPRPHFGYGGRYFNLLKPARRQALPGVFLGQTAAEACRIVRRLLPLGG
jgi:methanogenic corrinoid protein MtbC1